MNPDAYLIASTNIDWTRYLQEADLLLARNLTSSLDKRKLGVNGLPSYIATIAELIKQNSDPVKAVRYDAALLRHASLSFLVNTTKESIFEIMQCTFLAVAGTGISILSGTVEQWQQAVVSGTKPTRCFETRLLFDKIYILIDRIGLSEIFAAWNKSRLADQTFTLEPKE